MQFAALAMHSARSSYERLIQTSPVAFSQQSVLRDQHIRLNYM
jgi:hypothetical protein